MEQMLLIAFITGCFGMAIGIFFLLYCLEEPIYSPVLKKNAHGVDSDAQMRRVLLVLQQYLTFRVPYVMALLIISAMLGSAFRVALYGFAPLPVLVTISTAFTMVVAVLLVRPAVKLFRDASPEASPHDIQVALGPIVRLHRNVGIFVAVTLILHLASAAF